MSAKSLVEAAPIRNSPKMEPMYHGSVDHAEALYAGPIASGYRSAPVLQSPFDSRYWDA
jgi:hypothetical protein